MTGNYLYPETYGSADVIKITSVIRYVTLDSFLYFSWVLLNPGLGTNRYLEQISVSFL